MVDLRKHLVSYVEKIIVFVSYLHLFEKRSCSVQESLGLLGVVAQVTEADRVDPVTQLVTTVTTLEGFHKLVHQLAEVVHEIVCRSVPRVREGLPVVHLHLHLYLQQADQEAGFHVAVDFLALLDIILSDHSRDLRRR